MTATLVRGSATGRRQGPGIFRLAGIGRRRQAAPAFRRLDAANTEPLVVGERYRGLTVRTEAIPEWSSAALRRALQLSGIRLVAVDTETTSLEVRERGVTEIGWFDLNDGVGGGFIPPHSIDGASEEALKVSRYYERIAGKPMVDEVSELHRILGGDGSHVELVGSYPQFDVAHLNQLFAEHWLPASPWGRHPVDIGQAFYWVSDLPVGSRGGLAAAAEEFGIDNGGHHDAYHDALTAAHVWYEMENRRAVSAIPPF